jgi:hypothetical protein
MAGIFDDDSIKAAADRLITLAVSRSPEISVADQLAVYLERAYQEGANMARAATIQNAQLGLVSLPAFNAHQTD